MEAYVNQLLWQMRAASINSAHVMVLSGMVQELKRSLNSAFTITVSGVLLHKTIVLQQ